MKRLFDHDPLSGITRWWHVTGKGEYVIETQQDITKIVEMNKRSQNENHGTHGDMPKVATLPLTILFDLKRKGILDSGKKMLKWLEENPQWKARNNRLI